MRCWTPPSDQFLFFSASHLPWSLMLECLHSSPSAGSLYDYEWMQLQLGLLLLQPVAQPYGQVRTDWNQGCIIDCSLNFPAGHKPFTCSHSVLRNTWLNIHAVRWMRLRFSSRFSVHVFTISQNLAFRSLFVGSAVSELSSGWSINCFLRYVCCCIIVKTSHRLF